MKDITLSIDEQVLFTVTQYAAKHDSSVNSLVREYLTEIANQENRVQKARLKIRKLSDQSVARIGSMSWTRDTLHER